VTVWKSQEIIGCYVEDGSVKFILYFAHGIMSIPFKKLILTTVYCGKKPCLWDSVIQ
jgi:hypothetical protein